LGCRPFSRRLTHPVALQAARRGVVPRVLLDHVRYQSDAPPKGYQSPTSSDASSATSPARSSPSSPPAQQAITSARPKRCRRRLDMTAGAARCLYALRPAERPGCQLTAIVT